ncbi:hypothetical protein PAI11_25440 [Patulibacter medicamentivorans]|jgi:hypothetical protein|uniref:Peptidase C39-like domain-containing protein n=1 Tax=Patulibacter medicamentivorans TaxID=1097667 RepID=H0E6U3_9ACTN|nr:C39 family peptidase [Patulibacter medicamentivorans]EHN10584.1 hypothetical protein PAI11_25440 [Patulibacter medicamentivorans]
MSVSEDLTVPYYQQETSYYCGAACAKMVLEEIGAGALDQDDLYNDNHSHSTAESGWYSGPDGVNWTMNARKPATFNNFFVLFDQSTEDSISRKIAWTIHHYQVAPIAMVYGSAHWIVVRGYQADKAPTSSSDTSYALTGLFINNPWPPTGSSTSGIADEHISYTSWQGTYMTGVPGGHWAGSFLAVCDPEPAAKEVGRQVLEPGERRRTILDPREAIEAGLAGVERHGLLDHDSFAPAFRGAEPGEPRLVQRLDRSDSFYYVVPVRQRDRTSGIVSVGGLDARYHQAAALPEDSDWDLDSLARDAIRERFVGSRILVEGSRVRVPIRPEAVCVYPTLVWRPCRESLSPSYPFAMITVGDQRFYVRSDGQVFSRLHTADRGI